MKTPACPPLAYNLHLNRGVCSRLGGERKCGECIGDLVSSVFDDVSGKQATVAGGEARGRKDDV